MPVEGSKHHRGRSVRRSRTYASRNSTKDERIEFYGLPQGQEQPHDIREVGQYAL